MAKPENVARFFLYLSYLRKGVPISFTLWSSPQTINGKELLPIAKRQFLDDVAYLKDLLPLWLPGMNLELVGEGAYGLVRTESAGRLVDMEFLPFLKALVQTTNLFPFGADDWFARLEQTMGHPALKAVEGRILYTSTPHPDKLKSEPFNVLVKSLVERRRVTLLYRNREGVERSIEFEPMIFLNHNGSWYLLGDGKFAHRDALSNQPTQLKLSRIKQCTLGEEPFLDRFDLIKTLQRLSSTYGSHLILADSLEPLTATIRFYEGAVAHIDESWFHRDQIKIMREDGSLDLTLRVNDLFDALQLCGQWGPLCRPISPPELVSAWKDRCRRLAAWAESEGA